MHKSILKSTTALMVTVTLALPHSALAQAVQRGQAQTLDDCVNWKGVSWSDILAKRVDPSGNPLESADQAASRERDAQDIDAIMAKMSPDVPVDQQCAVAVAQEWHVFTGARNDTGELYVPRENVSAAIQGEPVPDSAPQEAAGEDAPQPDGDEADGLADLAESLGQQQGDAQTQEQQSTRPENRQPSDDAVQGLGNLAEALGQQQAEANAQAEAEQTEVEQDDTAESTATANQTATAQAANPEADNEGRVEVLTEQFTEGEIRSSDEDFATSLTAQGGTSEVDSDDGMSSFEKFALGALGAVAAGAILSDGSRVVSNSGDRVVVERESGEYEVLKDDSSLLRRPGSDITIERYSDGSTLETVTRANGSEVITIKAADGRVLRRTRILPDGTRVVLFDDTREVAPVQVTDLPRAQEQRDLLLDNVTADELRAALAQQDAQATDRRFSLRQIRQIRAVRELVPPVDLEAITFETDSAAIRPSEAEELRELGVVMRQIIDANPNEVFLVEGYTDAVGDASYNLALSDRRAESLALALTEYFDVPPENMVVQGYGESNLKVRTAGPERENRRVTVRRITNLLNTAQAQ